MKRSFFIFILSTVLSCGYSQIHNSAISDKYMKLAEDYKKNSMQDSAIVYYEKAAGEFQNSKRTEAFVNAYNQIGSILIKHGQYEKAMGYLDKALSAGLAGLDSTNAEIAHTYSELGNVYLNNKEFDRSIGAHVKAMRIRERLFGKNSPEIIDSYKGLGNAYKEKENYSTALAYYEMALKNKIAQRGEGHKDLVKYYNNVSEVYYLLGDYKQGDIYKAKADGIK